MFEEKELEQLRDLFRRALREADTDAINFVVAEAVMGVAATRNMDRLGEHGSLLSAEANDLRSKLEI
jgi:hypothetical protein